MCIYHYCYYSDCRHGELTRISYCGEATALNQPTVDRHSRNDADANGSSQHFHGASSFRLLASNANSSSLSRAHSQQQNQSQHYKKMSTLTPSPAGRSLILDTTVQGRVEQAHSQASLIPQSDLVQASRTRRADTLSDARYLLDSQGYSNVSIDIPSENGSSLDLKVTHDVSPHEPSDPSRNSMHSPASPAPNTARQHTLEQCDHPSPTQASSQLGQSPRKPLPAHWLPKAIAPNLATAQRAKERTHKKGSTAGSPSDTKILRLTRSSADLARSNGKEGATYLTKEALVAVESAVAPLASPQTPVKIVSPSSKPAWNSPVTPPAHGSARQHPMHTSKISPTKSTCLAAESMSAGHSRKSSSIATSTGKTSFHTANGSPVRSPASSVHSFQSAAESLGDEVIPIFDLSADPQSDQLPRNLNTSPTSAVKSVSGTRAGSSKSRLSFRRPNPLFDPAIGDEPLDSPPIHAVASAKNGSAGLVSAADTSRIPRASTTARGADSSRTSALQRVELVRALKSKMKLLQDAHVPPDETAASNVLTSDDSHVHAAMRIEHIPTSQQTQKIDLPSSKDEIPCLKESALAQGRSECTSSDLRPTAIEFVPRTSPAILPAEPVDKPENLATLQDVAGLPDMTALDRNGIPFLWYMYGVQFAYEQGYRNGRPKSPRKHKPKVARGSLSSPGGAPHTATTKSTDIAAVTAIHPSLKAKQRGSSAELMPPPPVPAHRLQPNYDHEDEHSSFQSGNPIHQVDDTAARPPFISQIDLIDQQVALSNRTNHNTPRHFNIDLTQVSDVGLPTGPRSMHPPMYHTMPRNHHRSNRHPGNGLYGGRSNAAGVPLDATTPFPNPIPPQGRQGHGLTASGSATDYSGFTIGKEACGIVDITNATERIGGGPCNACEPHH